MQFLKLLIVAAACFIGINLNAQNNFSKVDNWLNENTGQMGGRSYLMIYKDGKIIYSYGVDDMNMRQKWWLKNKKKIRKYKIILIRQE